MLFTTLSTPIGPLLLVGDEHALTALHLPGRHGDSAGLIRDDARFTLETGQLREYFAGERTSFDIPMRMEGGEFQRRVWAELGAIPYGETVSYGEIARRVGAPTASRAVGAANGANPIAIVVPCHRVIGASGSLTGYGGGLECKRALLDLEAGRAALV